MRQSYCLGSSLDKNIPNNINNIVFLGESVSKGINIKNLKTQLYNATCSCRFFGNATSKHFHHHICPNLNKTDIAAFHVGTNDIINSEVNKDLVADSIIVLILV